MWMGERIQMQVAGKVQPLGFAGGPPLLSSTSTPWAGLQLEEHRMRSVEDVGESGPLDGESGLMVITEGQAEFTFKKGRRDVISCAQRGCVGFVNGQHRPHVLSIRGNAQAIALHFSARWFERMLLEAPPSTFGMGEGFVHDATLLSLACAMRDEVARGAVTGRLYAESLSLALMSYAFERVPPSPVQVRGSLAEEQQRRLRNYIRDHLSEDLSLRELSALIGRSPRQFTTVFKRAFGMTPHRYVLKARLDEGARLLAQGGVEIAEVAFSLGFSSQSHFTSAFRRAFGKTPSAYALEKRTTCALRTAREN